MTGFHDPADDPVSAQPAPRPRTHRGPQMYGAVLGHPIGHSKSPAMHSAAYARLGLPYVYTALDTEASGLAALFARVRAERNWFGLSVTMPLKTAVLPLLDALEPVAAALRAVNTVVVDREDPDRQRLVGHNTDVTGIVNALRFAGIGERPTAAVLGGGGTAVSAVAALQRLGAPAADIFVRGSGSAAPATDAGSAVGLSCRLRPWTETAAALADYDVVISTLPPRAADPLADSLPPSSLRGRLLLDVAYDPWPSALAAAWELRGGTIVPGIEMLLYQGVEQVRLFTAGSAHSTPDVINVMCDAIGVPRR
ncbi:shikimate dehydrogenase [Arthrobacter sp. A5]|uniref:shikimate dehydrogenase n=1 Tax=Arthrobacter sp. A5 TaxID=576926 RepID=UPI003DA7EC86